MDKQLFENLLKQDEGKFLDFKETFYQLTGNNKPEKERNQSSFIKDLLAFANTIREGSAFIVLGVEDKNKDLVGIDKHDGNELLTVLKNRLNQIPDFHYENFEYDNKNFGIIEIFPKKAQMPYRAIKDVGKVKANTTYIRRGSSIDEAIPTEEKEIIRWFDKLENSNNKAITKSNYKKILLLVFAIIVIVSLVFLYVFKNGGKDKFEYLQENENYSINCLKDPTREVQCYFYAPIGWDRIEPPQTDFAFQDRYRKIINPLDTNAFITISVDISATYMLNDSINDEYFENILYSEINYIFDGQDTVFVSSQDTILKERKGLKIINKYPITIGVASQLEDNNYISKFAKGYVQYEGCTWYKYPSFKINFGYISDNIQYLGYMGLTVVNGVAFKIECVSKAEDFDKYEKDFSFIVSNFLPTMIVVEWEK